MVLFHVTIQIAMIDPKNWKKLHTGIEKEDQTDEEDVETVPENTTTVLI